MTTASSNPPRRRLLVNGEALRVTVQPPPRGGGEKHAPRTPEQARKILLPQVIQAAAALENLSSPYRADDKLYVEAKLLPNYLAASHFPNALLTQVGAQPIGSRVDSGSYVTKAKTRQETTRRLVLAVSDHGLRELRDLIDSGGRNRTAKQAFSEIRKLDEIAAPAAQRIVRPHAASNDPIDGDRSMMWEAVLHPAAIHSGEAIPLDASTLRKWFDLVGESGGAAYEDYVRLVGGLTFTPIRLTMDQVEVVARFNPLRVLRPMPAIRPRPIFGMRSSSKAMPPAAPAPVSTAATVAVFDGGVDLHGGSTALFPVVTKDLTPEAPSRDALDHGTGVTGAALYGLLRPGQQAPQPPSTR
ncbi:S8/S53 family peptidase, partial [Prescottella equi]|uniref:hypothetical protein n=1 Tax=Rhodococcus hoagii TaxID=43767 RepID=UPI001C2E83F9